MPFEVGHCRAAKRVFAFSLEAGVCEEKIYGGCGGNGNRFENAADCEQLCGCPTGERRVRTCERCGPAGGCEQEVVKCVRECTKPEDCGTEAIHACVNGVCGMACI